jgi:hypothetical protein
LEKAKNLNPNNENLNNFLKNFENTNKPNNTSDNFLEYRIEKDKKLLYIYIYSVCNFSCIFCDR